MDNIILIETSTELCSTAMASGGKIISYRESDRPRTHASLTAVFISEMLNETGMSIQDCSAVCVSMGPGSYTGLRVGVSTAKGLCFGGGLPLLAVGTLDTLVWQGITGGLRQDGLVPQTGDSHMGNGAGYNTDREVNGNRPDNDAGDDADRQACGKQPGNVPAADRTNAGLQGAPDIPMLKYIVPMIDARRMEVYTAVFSPDGKQLTETEAKIIDGGSFAEQLAEGPVLFIGDAADKCRTVITHPNAHFTQCCPKASSMIIPAMDGYKAKRFKDVAYFEPFYLKNFVATTSRKKLF